MRRFVLWMGLAPLAEGLVPAQTVHVHSEFQRIDPFGGVVPADRAERPREILSPAVARNGYASFHVAVTTPEGKPFTVWLGQNPDATLKLSLYREHHARIGDAWMPDTLERVLDPYKSADQPPGKKIPGQTTTVFWLDAWVPPTARVGRMRLEVQLNVEDQWIVYPMEVRIRAASIPEFVPGKEAVPGIAEPADRAALGPLRSFLCGTAPSNAAPLLTVRRMIRRNAQQDMALARSQEQVVGRDALTAALAHAAGAADVQSWCESPPRPRQLGAEWYLRVRDALLK